MWRRRHKQSALSRQLALARLEEALIRVEESQRSAEEVDAPGPGDQARTEPSRIPAQRSSGRAAQLRHAFFQARAHDGRDGETGFAPEGRSSHP
jgi:hypothetical protein